MNNRIKNKMKIQNESTIKYADYLCNLIESVSNMQTNCGSLILSKDEFDLLGKKNIFCTYVILDNYVILALDYSFRASIIDKSFDSININYFKLLKLLKDKGISINRVSEHPEYDEEIGMMYCHDKIIMFAPKKKKMLLEKK